MKNMRERISSVKKTIGVEMILRSSLLKDKRKQKHNGVRSQVDRLVECTHAYKDKYKNSKMNTVQSFQ